MGPFLYSCKLLTRQNCSRAHRKKVGQDQEVHSISCGAGWLEGSSIQTHTIANSIHEERCCTCISYNLKVNFAPQAYNQ